MMKLNLYIPDIIFKFLYLSASDETFARNKEDNLWCQIKASYNNIIAILYHL